MKRSQASYCAHEQVTMLKKSASQGYGHNLPRAVTDTRLPEAVKALGAVPLQNMASKQRSKQTDFVIKHQVPQNQLPRTRARSNSENFKESQTK